MSSCPSTDGLPSCFLPQNVPVSRKTQHQPSTHINIFGSDLDGRSVFIANNISVLSPHCHLAESHSSLYPIQSLLVNYCSLKCPCENVNSKQVAVCESERSESLII
ncbi:hypothetical protein BsWGS_29170 [Bradybaena similaris]